MSKVRRVIYHDGYMMDGEEIVYEKAEVQHRNNENWPGQQFLLRVGKWQDNKPEPDPGYLYLRMQGADVYLMDYPGEFIVRGFVPEPKDFTEYTGDYHLEKWVVSSR